MNPPVYVKNLKLTWYSQTQGELLAFVSSCILCCQSIENCENKQRNQNSPQRDKEDKVVSADNSIKFKTEGNPKGVEKAWNDGKVYD